MSGLTAQVRITSPLGYPVGIEFQPLGLRAVATINGIGYFEMPIAAADYPRELFGLDRRVEVSLQADGRAPRIAFIGLMRLYRENSRVSEFSVDYRDEINYVYVGGSGQGSGRTVRPRSDTAAMRASILNRREGFGAYPNSVVNAVLDAHGDKLLREGRVKTTLTRDLGELQPWVFGVDWALGDTLTIAADVPDTITLGGPGWNDLLARRVIAYATDSAEAKKTLEADSMMLEYVDENLVNPTDTARALDASLSFTVGPDAAAAPSVTHSATYGNLWDVLQDIADKSQQAGTQLRFGLQPVWDGTRFTPRFEARINRWGSARTWVLGSGPQNQTAEIAAIDIRVDAHGNATVQAKTEDTV